MFVFDTNILIAHLGDDPVVEKFIATVRASRHPLFLSVITEIELLSLPRLTAREREAIQALVREFSVVSVDSQVGRIAASIRRKSKLKLGDGIIAATAVLTNSTLVTRDREILKRTKGLVRVQTV